jgi:hypothetical protein
MSDTILNLGLRDKAFTKNKVWKAQCYRAELKM